jgi:hypothetical protein
MTSFEALRFFAARLERHIVSGKSAIKVVPTPSPINERGLVVKVSALKSYAQSEPKGVRASRFLRLRVSVQGGVESLTGLERALDAIEALDDYLGGSRSLRLERTDGSGAAGSRVIQTISREDGFFDDPDSAEARSVRDDRVVTITIPLGGET